jgi:LysM repeat protein
LQGSILTDLGAAINRYFAWMAGGSPLRYVFGLGGPILALFLFYMVVFGSGSDDPEELAVVSATPTQAAAANGNATTPRPAGSSAAVRGSTTPGTATTPGTTTTASTTTTPRATVAPGGTYVVKSGDTLGAICAANVPSMSVNDCVDAVVQLNRLESAASLQIDQQLIMPGGSVTPSAGGASTPAAATATRAAATATATP